VEPHRLLEFAVEPVAAQTMRSRRRISLMAQSLQWIDFGSMARSDMARSHGRRNQQCRDESKGKWIAWIHSVELARKQACET
jgi:hypothetical protein